ncbi:VOC family protein [Streptomyces sp. NBC_00424]|uniref:VOC family protein n=1 Tax=Streptomyces sp. NBC_00424 TaxID=2903648 RepID=UPI0022511FF9|nr:VOC family protein [Streptomyces sp. NBC_00424]MCX5077790.1 VOC family protein [Streptomyces sp. NBC_00424]
MGFQLNPYLAFDGNARQAMEFYHEVLGGRLELGTFGDFGSTESPDIEKIMHATLSTSDGLTVMAWDVPERVSFNPGTNVALYLGGDDGNLRAYFEKLSAGGTVAMPLKKQIWGDEAGTLVDRFGITWMFNITQQQP